MCEIDGHEIHRRAATARRDFSFGAFDYDAHALIIVSIDSFIYFSSPIAPEAFCFDPKSWWPCLATARHLSACCAGSYRMLRPLGCSLEAQHRHHVLDLPFGPKISVHVSVIVVRP
jgi:hypothetical protein